MSGKKLQALWFASIMTCIAAFITTFIIYKEVMILIVGGITVALLIGYILHCIWVLIGEWLDI